MAVPVGTAGGVGAGVLVVSLGYGLGGLPPELVSTLESSLLALQSSPEGLSLLKDIFNADRFEPAPRMGYRALYRVALASL